MRSQRQLTITAGGMLNLTIETFANVSLQPIPYIYIYIFPIYTFPHYPVHVTKFIVYIYTCTFMKKNILYLVLDYESFGVICFCLVYYVLISLKIIVR